MGKHGRSQIQNELTDILVKFGIEETNTTSYIFEFFQVNFQFSTIWEKVCDINLEPFQLNI